MMKKEKKNGFKWNRLKNVGFTLMEIMLAMAVLSIGILGVASLQIRASTGNARAAEWTYLNTVAADRVEKLMKLPYNSPLLSDTSSQTASPHQLDPNADNIDNDFDREVDEGDEVGGLNTQQIHLEWDVVEEGDLQNTKSITVRVTQGTGKKQRMVTLTYFRCRLN